MEILEHQADFIESDFVHTGLVGGYRSGKSQAGVIKTCLKKLSYPGTDVSYYLPTYRLIKDIAYEKFKTILDEFEVSYFLHESDHEFRTNYGKIILRSLDNPDSIVGYESGYSCIDEADILSFQHMEDAYKRVLARLSVPLPDGKANSLDFVSTPEGFNFLYDFFVKKANYKKLLIKASTKNNPFISDSYIETLKSNYSENELKAYLDGEFVNLTSGSVYHTFDRNDNHSNRVINNSDVLHIGMDFNVEKMQAVIHVTESKNLIAVEEICDVYDTAEMINIIKIRYPKRSIIIYPDASGDNRKSSSSDTDILLLRKAGFKINVEPTNPSVKDRINTMNAGFKDGNENTTYFINTFNCPNYTEAIEKISYKNGVPDKNSGFDHITDAGGYCAYKHLKIRKSKQFKPR